MLRKITPWLLFLLCLALLGLGATPFGVQADHITVGLRFSIVLFLSVLVVRQKFGNQTGSLLDSFRDWYRGETKTDR